MCNFLMNAATVIVIIFYTMNIFFGLLKSNAKYN